MTLLDELVNVLQRAAEYNQCDISAPAAIFFPDGAREWQALLPQLRACVPVLTLGAYNPAEQSGPAVWLRCAHARVLETITRDAELAVIYLPEISAPQLRAVTRYPRVLQPLADLYYRSAVWMMPDGQAWTIPAFLRAPEHNLHVEVRDDAATRKALRRALPRVAEMEVEALREGAPWKAADFDALLGFPVITSLRELILQRESSALEFKATARWDVRENQKNPEMEKLIWKTVAAFLNSYEGGTLLIGVTDDGELFGIQADYPVFKPQDRDRDGYEQWLYSKMLSLFGRDCIPHLRVTFHIFQGKEICQVSVRPSHKPVFVDENGVQKFYVRTGNASNPLNMQEAILYSLQRWGKP